MEPATRVQRLIAIAVDCVLVTAAFGWAGYEGFPDALRLVGLLVGIGLFGANLYFLHKSGQTVGKRVVGIRIVRADTKENGGFVVNVLKRSLLAGLPYLALIFISPILGALYIWADILFIFREDRRCLHDRIAGTMVIQAGSVVVQ